jgi:molybdopterin synthase sulfur carrier subunit
MSLNVLYFAWAREAVGVEAESCALAPTPAALADVLATRSQRHAALFAERGPLKLAVNAEFAGWDTPLADGDEVAFFPAVTGG